MLTKLSIKNYALINELIVDFYKGFNIVTGETGAGKSIILGALSLILGNRADSNSLRDNAKKCIVEGIFKIDSYGLKPFFEKNDLDFEDFTILRREITPSGKSRAFINDTPVGLKLMSEISEKLIDIHSQHQNLELNTQRFQLELVDIVAGNETILAEYKGQYFNFISKNKILSELKEKADKERADLDYYEFQFKQLDEAKLVADEQEELESEQEKLAHAEEIKNVFLRVSGLLENEESSILQLLNDGNNQLLSIKDFFKEASGLQERVESVYLELKDISDEIGSLSETVEYNPSRLEQISDRLDLIYSLQQKHKVNTVRELIELKSKFKNHISGIVDFDLDLEKLEKEIELHKGKLGLAAAKLSKKRMAVFGFIENNVTTILRQLGMPNSRFKVLHSLSQQFSESGSDLVGFLFSANKDSEPAEISKIASGGETSRLMLAIKSLMTNTKSLPTIIFDEIDSGVSGEIAIKMGDILKKFSKSAQIINITHLPQIAGKGDHHFKVYKYDNDEGTHTSIMKLDHNQRVEELSKMVGGNKPTQNAIQTAIELLN